MTPMLTLPTLIRGRNLKARKGIQESKCAFNNEESHSTSWAFLFLSFTLLLGATLIQQFAVFFSFFKEKRCSIIKIIPLHTHSKTQNTHSLVRKGGVVSRMTLSQECGCLWLLEPSHSHSGNHRS
jgi:hypothetical protein